ncbi:MAG: polysaccharide deacetylase family protein [Coleofasciculaceae cyanobacterium]
MQFAPLYPILYRILKPTFPNCLWAGSKNQRSITLTFDDGPHRRYTPELLQVLDRYNIKASFFWLGNCVTQASNVAREVYQRGHEIGLHGYYHRSFPLLSADALRQSLLRTQQAISQACQIPPERVRDVRPPNGLFTPQTLNLLQKWNYRPVMWSVVPEDWQLPGISVVVKRVLQQVENGSIIVLHDGYHGGENVVQTTEQLVPQLLQLGYKFVTISEFWQSHRL